MSHGVVIMSELPFFRKLHETKPVGRIGRGAHYSVMRVPIWHDKWLHPLPRGAMLDFAIIWDEDHDERVLEVIEELYFNGLLAPVRFIGERKGTLSILIDVETAETWKPPALRRYREAVSNISNGQSDPWPAYVSSLSSLVNLPPRAVSLDPCIIGDDRAKVVSYLKDIDRRWNVGIKQYALQVQIRDSEYEAYLESLEDSSASSHTDRSQSEDVPF